MFSNIAETHKYRLAGGSNCKILGKEKNQILAQGEVYTYMQYIGKLIKTLKVSPTLHKATKNVGTPSDITLADERRKPKRSTL